MIITIKILTWLIGVIGGNIAIHIYGIVKKKSKPDYTLTMVLRGMALIAFMIWVTIENDSYQKSILYFIPIVIFCLSSYVVIYSPTMNLLKNKFADAKKVGFWYLGETSGWLDPKLLKYPGWYKVFYFASCVFFILSTIAMFYNY